MTDGRTMTDQQWWEFFRVGYVFHVPDPRRQLSRDGVLYLVADDPPSQPPGLLDQMLLEAAVYFGKERVRLERRARRLCSRPPKLIRGYVSLKHPGGSGSRFSVRISELRKCRVTPIWWETGTT